MPEEQFDQNFTWYEWSFVCPGDVPSDDLRTTGANEYPDVGGHSITTRPEHAGGKPVPAVPQTRWTT